jgi:hypothetical protein
MTIIGPGIEIGPSITVFDGSLVLDLDAANYSAVPVNGSVIAGSGYPITVQNPTSRISWSSDNGGVFRVTVATQSNFFTFGPDYSSGTQALLWAWPTSGTGLLQVDYSMPTQPVQTS